MFAEPSMLAISDALLTHGCVGTLGNTRRELEHAREYYKSSGSEHAKNRLAIAIREFAAVNSTGVSLAWGRLSQSMLAALSAVA